MKLPLRIAILECDTPPESSNARYGGYAGIFARSFRRAADALQYPGLTSFEGLWIQRYNVEQGQYPEAFEDIDAIVLTGSTKDAHGDAPWVLKLVKYVKMILRQDRVRIIGVCFGHQIVGRALGQRITRGSWEISTHNIELTQKGKELFKTDTMNIFQMHSDGLYGYPEGVERIGETRRCLNQGMYERGRFLTLQGHPEFTRDIVEEFLTTCHESGLFNDKLYRDGWDRLATEDDSVIISMGILRFLLEEPGKRFTMQLLMARGEQWPPSRDETTLSSIPGLPYTLHTRKTSISTQWIGIIFFSSIVVLLLYFTLRFVAEVDTAICLAVSSAFLGVFAIISFTSRAYRLLRRSSDCRPLGASGSSLDYFQWLYLICFTIVASILSVACLLDQPNIRLAALPQSIVLYIVGSQLLFLSIIGRFNGHAPWRLSSTRRGSPVVPGTLAIVEDIVAVDGGAGQHYRQALMDRYAASREFRRLMWQMNLFWGLGAVVAATATSVLVLFVDDLNIVFIIGWTMPWAWAAMWTCHSFAWCRVSLAHEHSEINEKDTIAV